MAKIVSMLGGAFKTKAGVVAGLTRSMDHFATRTLVRATRQNRALLHVMNTQGLDVARGMAKGSMIMGAAKGAIIGGALGGTGAGLRDTTQGDLGFATPWHMAKGAFKGALFGGVTGGLGGSVLGSGLSRNQLRRMRP